MHFTENVVVEKWFTIYATYINEDLYRSYATLIILLFFLALIFITKAAVWVETDMFFNDPSS